MSSPTDRPRPSASSAAAILLERVAWRVALAAAAADPGRPPDASSCRTAPARRSATATSAERGEIRDPRPRGARPACSSAARPARGEAYMDGLWSSPDLAGAPALGRAQPRGARRCPPAGCACPASSRRTIAHRLRRNTRSRQPPQHRGPLRPRQRLLPAVPRRDDDLLERRLRPRRTSRSPTPSATSTGASRSGAGLTRGQHVLEIGTGWGGFALYAAGELGCRVTSITISQEQHDLARERVRDAGLERPGRRPAARLPRHRAAPTTRSCRSRCSRPSAPSTSRRSSRPATAALGPGGRLSLQVDHRSRTPPTSASAGAPTGSRPTSSRAACCPSLAVIERATRGHAPAHHAACTTSPPTTSGRCAAWRTRFIGTLDAVRAMGFDERFIRMWEYYLALSEAGFATGISQDLQIVFEKSRGIGIAPPPRSGSPSR